MHNALRLETVLSELSLQTHSKEQQEKKHCAELFSPFLFDFNLSLSKIHKKQKKKKKTMMVMMNEASCAVGLRTLKIPRQ